MDRVSAVGPTSHRQLFGTADILRQHVHVKLQRRMLVNNSERQLDLIPIRFSNICVAAGGRVLSRAVTTMSRGAQWVVG